MDSKTIRNFCFKNNIEANDNEINNINETNNSNDEDVSYHKVRKPVNLLERIM